MVSLRPSYRAWLDEYYCVSTDEKPVGVNVKNGSSMKEMDTGKKYMFDAEHQEWLEVSGSLVNGGGSSSGGSSNSSSGSSGGTGTMVVEVEAYVTETDGTPVYTVTNCSATFEEVANALQDGPLVTFAVLLNGEILFLSVAEFGRFNSHYNISASMSTPRANANGSKFIFYVYLDWAEDEQYPFISQFYVPVPSISAGELAPAR